MDPITTTMITAAITEGLLWLGEKTVEKTIVEPALMSAREKLTQAVARRKQQPVNDRALREAVSAALKEAGAPVNAEQDLQTWYKAVSFDRLVAKKNGALRRQMARAIVGFTDPNAPPPRDLVIALGWPRTQQQQLATFLATMRSKLTELPDWRASIEYANEAAALGKLDDVLAQLARLDNLFIETEGGQALRVVVVQQGLTAAEAAEIEAKYRAELVSEWRMHDFRGIVQIKKDLRLPLADIYTELGLLKLTSKEEGQQAHEKTLQMREAERVAEEERRLQDRVTDALARSQRLIILGEPGAGKTISLHFIALMLAYGYGAGRLGLDMPYIPIMVRLADYSRELEQKPALALENYLFQVCGQAYAIHPRLGDFLKLTLETGVCMVLLDGLDEVGDDPLRGQSLRTQVVKQVQKFADTRCSGDRRNRMVVTSRIEGYWDEALHGCEHVQLSPLLPPDEVQEFLMRWYAAHEQAHDETLTLQAAEARAETSVAELMPQIMESVGVRRLATNPLLLTILALIYDNLGKLPNRRIKLYEICAGTLIESWRQAQTGMPNRLLAELGEEKVIRIMAPLAYWLHEKRPGGTASYEEWHTKLKHILVDQEEHEVAEAEDISRRFLHHARQETGLLAERGLDRFGFFHLTFEEYLAAREIARQRTERRREMMRAHWEDARWHEVILLAAGQLGIVEARKDDVSDFLMHLLEMEPSDAGNQGRQAVIAGRALADIGSGNVNKVRKSLIERTLRQTMQDLNPDDDLGHPNQPPQVFVRTRYAAGEVLDELGWLPPDLDAWVLCPGCADGGGDLLAMKYPLTNHQFQRFIDASGYEDYNYWGGEKSAAWRWRVQDHPDYRGKDPVFEPEYWRHPHFGRNRRGYPVVGISWYEALAYATWLREEVRKGKCELQIAGGAAILQSAIANPQFTVRLPTEGEWERFAGGVASQNRYPWDPPLGPATTKEDAILIRANVREAGIGGTSPVGMYPLGASQPFGLMDLAGNVWEWTATAEDRIRALRGGSWYGSLGYARCGARDGDVGGDSGSLIGCRLVSPIVSVS